MDQPPERRAPTDSIAVIVPAFHVCTYLRKVVAALGSQTLPLAEVIVVHSGPGDPTQELAGFAPFVRVVHHDRRLFAGAARNIGVGLTTAGIIAFIDADTVPRPQCIEYLFKAHLGHGRCIVIGAVDRQVDGGYWGWSRWFMEFISLHPNIPAGFRTGVGASCNLLVDKRDFLAHGGFRSNFRAGEDLHFFLRLPHRRRRVYFEPRAVVGHVNLPAFRRNLKHAVRIGTWSAIARTSNDLSRSRMSASWLRALSPLFGGYRFIKIMAIALRHGAPDRRRPLAHSPGVALMLCMWQIGFWRGMFSATPAVAAAPSRQTQALPLQQHNRRAPR